MTTAATSQRARHSDLPLGALTTCALLLTSSFVAAFALARVGYWALMFPGLAAGLVAVARAPARLAGALLMAAIVFEPGAIDFTGPLSTALYRMPPGFEDALGVTTSPLEILTLAAACSAGIRHRGQALPAVAWLVPMAVAGGIVYGLAHGAAANLAYNEARGLIVGIAIFVLARATLPDNLAVLGKLVMLATFALALVMLVRYFTMIRPGNYDVPIEFAFSHEGSVILGIGLVVGALTLLQHSRSIPGALVLALYCGVVVAAILVTGRRAGTLVVIVGCLSTGILLLPRRPVMVVALAVPLALGTAAYLATFWNVEYGSLAQPARAIRSEFDPSVRDQSSDQYREVERSNVIETLRLHRLFGVGFGLPFYSFAPLPDLTSFWPLQRYTPHQNILWLWLKVGILGLSAILGFAVLALRSCVVAMRADRHGTVAWSAAAAAFSGILMALAFSTVDIALVGPRGVFPAAVAAAVAFRLADVPRGVTDVSR